MALENTSTVWSSRKSIRACSIWLKKNSIGAKPSVSPATFPSWKRQRRFWNSYSASLWAVKIFPLRLKLKAFLIWTCINNLAIKICFKLDFNIKDPNRTTQCSTISAIVKEFFKTWLTTLISTRFRLRTCSGSLTRTRLSSLFRPFCWKKKLSWSAKTNRFSLRSHSR